MIILCELNIDKVYFICGWNREYRVEKNTSLPNNFLLRQISWSKHEICLFSRNEISRIRMFKTFWKIEIISIFNVNIFTGTLYRDIRTWLLLGYFEICKIISIKNPQL